MVHQLSRIMVHQLSIMVHQLSKLIVLSTSLLSFCFSESSWSQWVGRSVGQSDDHLGHCGLVVERRTSWVSSVRRVGMECKASGVVMVSAQEQEKQRAAEQT
jgi:hypothetical protein